MNDPAIQLGKVIENLRFGQRLSQRELAEKMGVSRQTISRWERGNGTLGMSLTTFFKLTQALKTSPTKLTELVRPI